MFSPALPPPITTVHIWTAISCLGPRQISVWEHNDTDPPTFNARDFVSRVGPHLEALRDRIKGGTGRDVMIAGDNTSWQRTKPVKDYHRRLGNIVFYWPPHSQDLNPLKPLLVILEQKVAARLPRSTDEVFRFLLEEFDNVARVDVCLLCKSVPGRLGKLIVKQGYPLE